MPASGPYTPVYADNTYPYQSFCQRYRPDATSVFEGISAGWRDDYPAGLAYQWVDVSDVQPGEYWLREDVNPLAVVRETGGANVPAYAAAPTIIPGFDALPKSLATPYGAKSTLTLTAQAFADNAQPAYRIVTPPSHGTLGSVEGDEVAYTPESGYSGPDSFTFSASDPNSHFPEEPTVATVAIEVGEPPPQPRVTILTVPASMTAGTSAALLASVSNYLGGVEWSVTGGGTMTSEPPGLGATYTAPAQEGQVTVTARLAGDPAVSESRTIAVIALPPGQPAPEGPPPAPPTVAAPEAHAPEAPAAAPGAAAGQGGQAPAVRRPSPALSRPEAMLSGRELVLSTVPSVSGRVRLSAFIGRRRIASCAAASPAGRRFVCRALLALRNPARARIAVVATLRTPTRLVSSSLPAATLPTMVMTPAGMLRASARTAAYAQGFWCAPSTLLATLVRRRR